VAYSGQFVDFYDKIFSKKRYDKEVDFILDAYKKYSRLDPLSKDSVVLDVGCGTGTHSLLLSSKAEAKVFGIDESLEMISKALQKRTKFSNVHFYNDSKKISGVQSDLIISMFHVVNHIHNLKDVEEYFEFVSSHCKKDGIFIFDCMNGVATLRDPPYNSMVERYSDDEMKIVTLSSPDTDLLTSTSNINNQVMIFSGNKMHGGFEYTLKHIFWTPFILSSILEKYDFDVVEILRPYNLEKKASYKDYKIVYVCRKKSNL